MVRNLKLVVRQPGIEPGRARGIEPGPAGLTDESIGSIRPGKRLHKVSAGGSLYLWIAPASSGGSRIWRWRFRLEGRQHEFTIGPFGSGTGEFTLEAARAEADRARATVAAGGDPVQERRAVRVNAEAEAARRRAAEAAKLVTFSDLAEEWFASRSRTWSPAHRSAQRARLDNLILPVLGSKPLGLVDAPTVRAFLQSLERRGTHETLAKCRIVLSQVFRHGVATGRASDDPTLSLRGTFTKPDTKHRATVEPDEFPALFDALAAVPAEEITKLAAYWCMATACRTHEMRNATWREIGTARVKEQKHPIPVWRVPVERMKMRTPWTQPLSPLALSILERARAHRASNDPDALIFPGFSRSGTLSENALLALLARAGFYGRQTTHGFRGSFSTWAHEFTDETMAVELCLAHRPGGVLGVYHKGEHLVARLSILTAWGEHLRELGLPL